MKKNYSAIIVVKKLQGSNERKRFLTTKKVGNEVIH